MCAFVPSLPIPTPSFTVDIWLSSGSSFSVFIRYLIYLDSQLPSESDLALLVFGLALVEKIVPRKKEGLVGREGDGWVDGWMTTPDDHTK